MAVKYTNNASSTLASAITNSATTITLASGGGAKFPSLGAGDYFFGTMVSTDASTVEIVKVTARSSDTLTVVRGQDNTTAAAWDSGTKFESRACAALFNEFELADATILKDADIGVSVQGYEANLAAFATKTAPSGDVVGTTDQQTLTNKTLTGLDETKTAPSITSNTLTLDCNAGNVFAVSLDADIATLTFSNAPTSGTAYALTLSLTADGTARTITWGAAVKWPSGTAPTITSTSGKVDTFVLTTWDAGTTWYAFTAGQNA